MAKIKSDRARDTRNMVVGCRLSLVLPSRASTVTRLKQTPRQEHRLADTAATRESVGLNNRSVLFGEFIFVTNNSLLFRDRPKNYLAKSDACLF